MTAGRREGTVVHGRAKVDAKYFRRQPRLLPGFRGGSRSTSGCGSVEDNVRLGRHRQSDWRLVVVVTAVLGRPRVRPLRHDARYPVVSRVVHCCHCPLSLLRCRSETRAVGVVIRGRRALNVIVRRSPATCVRHVRVAVSTWRVTGDRSTVRDPSSSLRVAPYLNGVAQLNLVPAPSTPAVLFVVVERRYRRRNVLLGTAR